MSDLLTLRIVSPGAAEFNLPADALAAEPGNHTLLLASVVGASSQVQSFAAMLQSNVRASFALGYKHIPKFDGGYDCHKHKLGYGTWHLLAIARRPGLMLDASDAALWRELRSERYTTPVLKSWLPYLRTKLTAAELLTTPEQKGCNLCLLEAETAELDGIVSEGVKCGELLIA